MLAHNLHINLQFNYHILNRCLSERNDERTKLLFLSCQIIYSTLLFKMYFMYTGSLSLSLSLCHIIMGLFDCSHSIFVCVYVYVFHSSFYNLENGKYINDIKICHLAFFRNSGRYYFVVIVVVQKKNKKKNTSSKIHLKRSHLQ